LSAECDEACHPLGVAAAAGCSLSTSCDASCHPQGRSVSKAGPRAVVAMSRLHHLYEERQRQLEKVMEEFGEAVANPEASAGEVERLSREVEKLEADVETIARLKEEVEVSNEAAEKCLQQFGEAVEGQLPPLEQQRLSLKAELARLEAERVEEETVKAAETISSSKRSLLERQGSGSAKFQKQARDGVAPWQLAAAVDKKASSPRKPQPPPAAAKRAGGRTEVVNKAAAARAAAVKAACVLGSTNAAKTRVTARTLATTTRALQKSKTVPFPLPR